MSLIKKISAKASYLYRYHIKKEPFLLEVSRWFSDKGDDKLRLDYPLTKASVVFDVGGYHGDFAALIHEKYECKVYVFEPVKEFYQMCVDRFKGNSKIICLNYGLSSNDAFLNIGLADNASSFDSPHVEGDEQRVEVRSVVGCMKELGIGEIDLFKINIEGGEFDVLPALIDSGAVNEVNFFQIQFHNFVNDAENKRNFIRSGLENTHQEEWCYEFVWESWKRKGD